MSTYAIGDIHGCLEELQRLIGNLENHAGLCKDDVLVFVGDYIDRGPDSKGVIDYLLELDQKYSCVFLMGNHEDMALWYLGIDHGSGTTSSHRERELAGVWIINGGDATLRSYGIDVHTRMPSLDDRLGMANELPETHIDFLKGLQYFYIEGDNLFVHAGVSQEGLRASTPQEAAELSPDKNLLWDRSAFGQANSFGTMIYGHTVCKEGVRWGWAWLKDSPQSVGLDVGCVFTRSPLVAVRTSDWKEFT
jgi:serine/threonine protein phosphatase 1